MSEDVNPATESEDAEPALTKKERRLGCLYSSFAFFVSYVITAGPAVFITRRFDQPMFSRIVEFLYAPLILIIKMDVPIVSPVIKVWVQLFR